MVADDDHHQGRGASPVSTDPGVRTEAANILTNVFTGIGQHAQGQGIDSLGLGGLSAQVEQFAAMPLELARIFTVMAVQLTELVLQALEEAGIVLAKGVLP